MEKSKLAMRSALVLMTIFTASAHSRERIRHFRHARMHDYHIGYKQAGGYFYRGRKRLGTPERGYCQNDGKAGCTLVPSWFQQGGGM